MDIKIEGALKKNTYVERESVWAEMDKLIFFVSHDHSQSFTK